MNNRTACFIALVASLFVSGLLGLPAAGVTPALPRDPEVPWRDDPDIEALEDTRLAALWEDIMLTYRRNNPFGRLVDGGLYDCKDFTAEPLRQEDQAYLIDALAAALAEEPVDWNYVRTVLILMYKGIDPYDRIPQLAHYMFTLPRAMKVSSDQYHAYRSMIFILGRQRSEAAAQVLYNATIRSYWGDDPMNVPQIRNNPHAGELAIVTFRRMALGQLHRLIPPAIRLPWLERIAAAYPMDYEPPTVNVGTEERPDERAVDLRPDEVHMALNSTLRSLAREAQEAAAKQEQQ